LRFLARADQLRSIDTQIGQRAGDFLGQFAKNHSVEVCDALIAASAPVHNLTLWTRNRRHYPMKEIVFLLGGCRSDCSTVSAS
jgi:predicted nucleic acid-binding protein